MSCMDPLSLPPLVKEVKHNNFGGLCDLLIEFLIIFVLL